MWTEIINCPTLPEGRVGITWSRDLEHAILYLTSLIFLRILMEYAQVGHSQQNN